MASSLAAWETSRLDVEGCEQDAETTVGCDRLRLPGDWSVCPSRTLAPLVSGQGRAQAIGTGFLTVPARSTRCRGDRADVRTAKPFGCKTDGQTPMEVEPQSAVPSSRKLPTTRPTILGDSPVRKYGCPQDDDDRGATNSTTQAIDGLETEASGVWEASKNRIDILEDADEDILSQRKATRGAGKRLSPFKRWYDLVRQKIYRKRANLVPAIILSAPDGRQSVLFPGLDGGLKIPA